jgi:FkbM family methyltransferase
MNLVERLHMLHRAWRYRLRSERDEVSFLLSRKLAGQTVADIGANRGIYSYWMHKKVGPRGHVVAFEPQPELNEYLNDLKSVFHLRTLIIANAGLSSSPGERRLIRPKHHWGGASLERGPSADCDSLIVRVTTLDEYFLDNPLRPLRFIKCDVEGHEYDVFLGGKRVLQEDCPDLLFECHDAEAHRGTLFAYLSGLGYEGFFFANGKLVPVSHYQRLRATISKPYLNYVFLPKNKATVEKVSPITASIFARQRPIP